MYVYDKQYEIDKKKSVKNRERERDGWMDGLLYNQWIDHNNIVGER